MLQEELKDNKIMILYGYKEIIKINKISIEDKVTIANGKEIKLEKMFDIKLSLSIIT